MLIFEHNVCYVIFGRSFLHEFETKCHKLAEPKILCETTNRKRKDKKKEVRIDGSACRSVSCDKIKR